MRRTLEAVVNHKGMPREAGEYGALLTYLKRIWFSNGIHHHASNRKFLPEGLRPETFAALVREVPAAKLPLGPGETVEQLIARLTPIMFDPKLAAQTVNKDAAHDPVSDSANHFYVNLTKSAVLDYTRAARAEGRPNTRLLRPELAAGRPQGRQHRGAHLEAWAACTGRRWASVVRWLDRAWPIAENEAQARGAAPTDHVLSHAASSRTSTATTSPG